MKLTNWHREQIVKAASHAAFAKRQAEHNAALRKIGDKAYIKLFSPKLRKQMEELGDMFVSKSDTCKFSFFADASTEDRTRHYFLFTKPVPVPRALFDYYYGVEVPVDAIKPLIELESAEMLNGKKLKEERGEFEKQVKGLLSTVTTVAKLMEVWPECRDLMPATFWKDEPKLLPAINTAHLNEMILAGKPVPEAVATA